MTDITTNQILLIFTFIFGLFVLFGIFDMMSGLQEGMTGDIESKDKNMSTMSNLVTSFGF